MSKPLTADDLLPLVACLEPHERIRLLQLIALRPSGADTADAYRILPPARGEFTNDEEPLAWDAGGWEHIQ
jgi:hypothetical protein